MHTKDLSDRLLFNCINAVLILFIVTGINIITITYDNFCNSDIDIILTRNLKLISELQLMSTEKN